MRDCDARVVRYDLRVKTEDGLVFGPHPCYLEENETRFGVGSITTCSFNTSATESTTEMNVEERLESATTCYPGHGVLVAEPLET